MYTDLHCHMLPGIDDGARDLDQALAMARLAVADGIRTAVMTPHHLNGVYNNPSHDVLAAVALLREALLAEGIGLKILPGAELHLVPELPGQLAAGQAMTLGNHGRAVLVELPVHTIPMGSEHILEQILGQGLVPIIAHPERNSQLRREPERLEEWVGLGCLGQITAQSCTGQFGPQVQAASKAMICRGLIHMAASDAHRDRRRIPQLSAGQAQIASWTNAETAELITVTIPARLAQGLAVDSEVVIDALPDPRRSWWQRIFH